MSFSLPYNIIGDEELGIVAIPNNNPIAKLLKWVDQKQIYKLVSQKPTTLINLQKKICYQTYKGLSNIFPLQFKE